MISDRHRQILLQRAARAPWSRTPTLVPGAQTMPAQVGMSGTTGPAGTLPARSRHPGDVAGMPTQSSRLGQAPPTKYDLESALRPYMTEITDVSSANWFSPFQPVQPFGPPWVNYPREWDYPVGVNLDFAFPRLDLYRRLRTMSSTWGVLRTIIESRKDQLLRLPWEIQKIGKPRASSPALERLRERFRRPDGKRSFNQWLRMLLEDMLVIDAPCLYVGSRAMDGSPVCMEVVDGTTIKPLIDDAGRPPDAPSPAYQQIVKGLPMENFDETEIIYAPMRPRPESPIYGYSPVEQIYLEVSEAIRKTLYTLGFWTEGNLPELLMTVPKDWTTTQIATFQALFDTELSGNLQQKSRVRFVPEGMRPYDVKSASGEGLYSQRDEMLIRLACYAFNVAPTPFIRQMNRATAATAAEEAAQEGLHPLMSWVKDDIMDRLIQVEHGADDTEFVWLPQPEVDQLKRSQIYMNLMKSGLRSINELRDEMGLPPVVGGDEILVFTNNGVMTLTDALKLSHLTAAGGAVSHGAGAHGPEQDRGGESADRLSGKSLLRLIEG